ncbi:unnamed protein product [Linum tenue]|uniref:F-box domain-containing protein n=1 Tax=Linum tenue TaxID=586396 RepID=A0AAV0KMX6_9ROSI|nr:unnamed protein product [Linum tenue]
MISKLRDDLLVEVLIRVPEPSSRCRCKLVCKQWNSLLSDPYFVPRFDHHRNHIETPLLPSDTFLSFLPVPDELRKDFRIFDAFKDLLLCGFAELLASPNCEADRSYLLCNPSTKQWMALPLAPEMPPRYFFITLARLVCEPRGCSQGGQSLVRHRFRVVCMHQSTTRFVRVDVFCSESGKWIKDALNFSGYGDIYSKTVISCNGELFWTYFGNKFEDAAGSIPLLAAVNPFRLDIPPTHIDASTASFSQKTLWNFGVSQDALHLVVFELKRSSCGGPSLLSVWRLEEDRKSWSRRYETKVDLSRFKHKPKHEVEVIDLHPGKPEIVFLRFIDYSQASESAIWSCNLRSGESEIFCKISKASPRWRVFEQRLSCWPIPIPRYEELRGMYDGSYSSFCSEQHQHQQQ